jgi:hypothetical protein
MFHNVRSTTLERVLIFQQHRNQMKLGTVGLMATIRSACTFTGVEERSHENRICSISDRNRVADIASSGGKRPRWCGPGCQFHPRGSDGKRAGMQCGMWPRTVFSHRTRDLRVRLSPDLLRQRIQLSAGLLSGSRLLRDTAVPWLLPLIACGEKVSEMACYGARRSDPRRNRGAVEGAHLVQATQIRNGNRSERKRAFDRTWEFPAKAEFPR